MVCCVKFDRRDGLRIFGLAARDCFCNIIPVAQDGQASGENSNASFEAAYKDVRADEDIQFAVEQFKPPEIPQWWKDLSAWLEQLFVPVAEVIVYAWPVLKYVLLGLLAAGVLALIWVILAPYIEEWRGRQPRVKDEQEWRPEEGAARRWLEEADVLAGKGQYDEAAHLLLYRSIEDIERRRPHMLRPSNTAREIERFESLPDRARNMFAVIAGYVERGIFGATPIGQDGWTAARNAYGEFALADSWKAVTQE